MLKDCIPEKFARMTQMKELFDAEQPELDAAETEVESWARELFIMTAERSLELWEQDYAIETDESLTIQQRRYQIMEKMRGRILPRKALLESILKSLSGAEDLTIEENDCVFTIISCQGTTEGGFDAALAWFKKVKASHYGFEVECHADASGGAILTASGTHVTMCALDTGVDFCIDVTSQDDEWLALLADENGAVLVGSSHTDRSGLFYGRLG